MQARKPHIPVTRLHFPFGGTVEQIFFPCGAAAQRGQWPHHS